jgi:hypothetical protein
VEADRSFELRVTVIEIVQGLPQVDHGKVQFGQWDLQGLQEVMDTRVERRDQGAQFLQVPFKGLFLGAQP